MEFFLVLIVVTVSAYLTGRDRGSTDAQMDKAAELDEYEQ